ncbi:tetratricopeptide repeat protein [Pricia sp. S334]|uniref:Tetratricopeptide repeat protein n=1 Tax=Pricia mediterranea TaxID=3076079 RepID=A0ABU3L2Z1_9FLAO|nr:tetratricopeptide repeat protein [Pricia sp. S334]MDT7827559.1 tetratricopeptide repeat protein [Pricia sp. S334]
MPSRQQIKWIIVFCFSCGVLYLRGQEEKVDSLKVLLTKADLHDTVRLATLTELSYTYYSLHPEEGVRIADQALMLAKRLKDDKGIATALSYKGHNYSAQGMDSMALSTYDKAIELHGKNKNKNGIARLTYNKGLVYFNQSDYRRANDHNLRAYTVFEKEKDTLLMAKMLNSIGINQMYLTQYPEALASYLEAEKFYRDLNLTDDQPYANLLANIGLLYARLEELDQAHEYQKRALQLFRKLAFQEGEANALLNLGRVYEGMGHPEKGIGLYGESYTIMEKNHNERGMASALTNMGIAYTDMGEYEKAIPYFEETKTIYEGFKNTNNLAIVHQNLGDCHKNLSWDNRLARAEDHYRISLNYAKAAGSLNLQYKALENLAKLQAERGEYKDAYANKSAAVVLRDSFASIDKKEEIARLETKHAYDREKSILNAEHDREQAISKAAIAEQTMNKNRAVAAIGFLCLAGLIAYLIYKKRRDIAETKKIADFKVKVAETELKALRAQMNPHFIFNALNSISDYMAKNDIHTAQNFLIKFSKLIRSILENSEKTWIPLAEDLELTELYMKIEALRLKDKFTYSFEVADDIDIGNTMVPPLILQPFIENSIWHGISKKSAKGHIGISIRRDQNFLVCSVDDDGVGRQKTIGTKEAKSSMGLKITKNRLDIINRLKQENGSIGIFDKKEGLHIELKLPLELQF